MPVTNCEALNIHYDRWTREEIPIRHTLESLQRIIDTVKAVHNAPRTNSEELDIVKKRQAVAAAISALQFLLFLLYMGVKKAIYTVKKCRKHHARLAEEEIELIESRLENRKAKRRAQAARKAAQEIQ